MAASVLVDASFLVGLISRRDRNHRWAAQCPFRYPPPWNTCEAVLSETVHLVGAAGTPTIATLLRRHAVVCSFRLNEHLDEVLQLMRKYANVPMSLADACLVRMTETLPEPALLTADTDFRIYRRHSRQTVPCVMPAR
jgi:predicted nucleic acid-binding protein